MEPGEASPNQSAVNRLVNLPLVSSTWLLLSLLYGNAKQNHPRVKSLCEVAETGVKSVTSVAVVGVTPLVNKLQPQIAAANQLACKCLDKTEKVFPVLHRSLPQVIASSNCVLTKASSAKDVMVSGTKGTVVVAVSKAGTALHDAVGAARSVLANGIGVLTKSQVGQLLSNAVKTTLAACETLMGGHPPCTEEELEEVPDPADNKPGCLFLSSISRRLQKKPMLHSSEVQDRTRVKMAVVSSDGVAYTLQTLCLTVVSSLQNVNQNIQTKVLGMVFSITEVCSTLWRSSNQGDSAGSVEVIRIRARSPGEPEMPLTACKPVCEISPALTVSICNSQVRRRLKDFGSVSQTP